MTVFFNFNIMFCCFIVAQALGIFQPLCNAPRGRGEGGGGIVDFVMKRYEEGEGVSSDTVT